MAEALITRWSDESRAPDTAWVGPDGSIATQLERRGLADPIPLIIGPRGVPGVGTLGVLTMAELEADFPAAEHDGSFAIASDVRGGVVVWAVNGAWTSHAPSLAALEAAAGALDTRTDQLDAAAASLTAALAAEAEARSSSDIETANRLDAAEQTLGADPGDLTILFENGLV